jgi:glutamine synthetase
MQILCRIWTRPIQGCYRASATDGLIYSQKAIRSIAFKHAVYATFHPKPLFYSEQRNGLPMHFSVESSNEESIPDKSLAGLLKHL